LKLGATCFLEPGDGEAGSGSGFDEGPGSGSGSDVGDDDHDFDGARQRSFHVPPEFDYGISFDIFSRPPVEVVTRRMLGSHVTVHYSMPTDKSSCRPEPVGHLPLLLVVATIFLCRWNRMVVAAP